MFKNLIIPLGFICLLNINCRHNKTPAELMDTFYKNEDHLTQIIKTLQTDKHLDSLCSNMPFDSLPNIENAYPTIFNRLKSIGIKHISSHPGSNKLIRWYYLETKWPNEYLIGLIYSPYDSPTTKKGYYEKDEVNNETWGLGNNWSMFRLVKYKKGGG